jgi:hypothetical protein
MTGLATRKGYFALNASVDHKILWMTAQRGRKWT